MTVTILLSLGIVDGILSLEVFRSSIASGQTGSSPLGFLLIVLVVATLDVFMIFLWQVTGFRKRTGE